MSRDRTRIAAVPDETIVIDDLVGVAILDTAAPSARVVWANPAFASVLGRGSGDVAGRPLTETVDDPALAPALAETVEGDERTVRLVPDGGAAVVLQLSPTGRDGTVLAVARPVHSTPRAAMYDAVTGLASLELFREHLQLGLNRRARDGDDIAVVAVTAADFGAAWQEGEGERQRAGGRGSHDAETPSLLQTRMAERIEQIVRDADVLAARRPGAFLLLVVDPEDAVAAATLASERMLAAFDTPLVLSARLQPLDLHIGIAAALPDDDPDRVVARADGALAHAVRAGANRYRIALT